MNRLLILIRGALMTTPISYFGWIFLGNSNYHRQTAMEQVKRVYIVNPKISIIIEK